MSSMLKDSIDLMNVEYEDVLHLYRGWRKSESALKDKNKELAALKSRITQLQDSHVKFRGQIQSLDSVKDLTVTLQNQLSMMQQENKQLAAENKELAQLNLQADELLKEKEHEEENQTKMLRSVQMDFATLRGRYEETTKAQRELEKLASDEQALRLATEARFHSIEDTVRVLREENRELRNQLDSAAMRLNQCDQELLHASEQLGSLSRETNTLHAAKSELSTKEAEVALIKGDISRLLRLLEHSPATKNFIAQWQDSNGMDFVGIDRNFSAVAQSMDDTHAYLHAGEGDLHRTALDASHASLRHTFGQVNNESTLANTFDLTPAEFAHLKRIHGGDPFPMTSNMADEAEYWVPSEAARLGLEFLSAKMPHASPKVIMDFLRNMNKIWLRRERRKIKRVKEVMGDSIEDLKRQLAQAKPYKGVIAERQIRRLKNQVMGQRIKHNTGRPRSALDLSSGRGGGRFESLDQQDLDETSPPHERRLCKLMARSASLGPAPVSVVSTEKLLEASLQSLESLGRHMHVTSGHTTSMGHEAEEHSLHTSSSAQPYPNDSYLRGAMWLGRNFTILSEELAEEMSEFRTKFMNEVAVAGQDTDMRRASHRLTLLANSGITQAHAMTIRSNGKVREILQGASALTPGDARAFKALLRTLPIESALTQGESASPTRHSHAHSHSLSHSHSGGASPSRHQQHYNNSFLQSTHSSMSRSMSNSAAFH